MSDIISDEGRQLFEIINLEVISFTVGVLGIVGNIINAIVFCKQGFSNTVNIAFLGLAVSDLFCLISLVWTCFCLNPLFINSGVPWVTVDVAFISGSVLHICFCRITSFITVYITAERYISIAFPLKVKQIVTGERATVIICAIYFFNISAVIPEYASSYLDWRFVVKVNKTVLALMYNNNRKSVEGIGNVLNSILGATSFFGVVMATAALVTKLNAASRWRTRSTSHTRCRETTSAKEQMMVKMVVLIACAMIVCYTPGVVICLTTYIIGPEFNILGRYFNSCISMWAIAHSFQAINSSINILLYYTMSSNYKRTFHELFSNNLGLCWKRVIFVYSAH